MMSIRFFSGRARVGRDGAILTRGGASVAVVTPRLYRLEPDQPSGGDLAHPTVRDQQVDVPDHLRQGEEGLSDGDVPPELLGDLVGRARPLGDQGEDLFRAAPVELEALVDQGPVICDWFAVARE